VHLLAIQSPAGGESTVRAARLAIVALALTTLSAVTLPARAQLDLSVAARAGTLGAGVEADLLLTSHIGVRAGYNGLVTVTYTTDNSGITYNGEFDFLNMPLLVDIYPSARGTFHFTGGMILNQNKVTATGVLSAGNTIDINGTSYTEADLGGPLLGTITYPSTAWYAGLGWGTPVRTSSHWGFVCDLGVMIATPTAALTAPNAAANAVLQQNLQAQMDSTQANLKKYATYWPSISFGVSYRF